LVSSRRLGGREREGIVCAIHIMHDGYILLKLTSDLIEVQEVEWCVVGEKLLLSRR